MAKQDDTTKAKWVGEPAAQTRNKVNGAVKVRIRTRSAQKRGAETALSDPDQAKDMDALLSLIDEWMADDSDYEDESWEELKAALDRDRLSARPFFVE